MGWAGKGKVGGNGKGKGGGNGGNKGGGKGGGKAQYYAKTNAVANARATPAQPKEDAWANIIPDFLKTLGGRLDEADNTIDQDPVL